MGVEPVTFGSAILSEILISFNPLERERTRSALFYLCSKGERSAWIVSKVMAFSRICLSTNCPSMKCPSIKRSRFWKKYNVYKNHADPYGLGAFCVQRGPLCESWFESYVH